MLLLFVDFELPMTADNINMLVTADNINMLVSKKDNLVMKETPFEIKCH